jgi:hypothetical protein
LQLKRQGVKLTAEQEAKLSLAARILLKHRLKRIGKRGLRKQSIAGGKAHWAGMTPTERSLEMRRRCAIRDRRRREAAAAR